MHATAILPTAWNRAVSYGDGLFETVLVINGAAPLWSWHRERLQKSLQRMHLHCDLASLENDFISSVANTPDAIVKITVARSGGRRGYDARLFSSTVLNIQSYPLPAYPQERMTDGIRLHLCRQRLSHNPALAGLKHLNRLEQVMAASEWNREWADEGLMLDTAGAVIEGTMSNIFIFRDGALQTPRIDHCGVAGVMRAAICQQIAQDAGLPVQEARLFMTDILRADSVFLCNSVFGIWPVCSLGVSSLNTRPELIGRLWKALEPMGYRKLYG